MANIARTREQRQAGLSVSAAMAINNAPGGINNKSPKTTTPTRTSSGGGGGTSTQPTEDIITDNVTGNRYSRNPLDQNSKYSLYTGPTTPGAPASPGTPGAPSADGTVPLDAPPTNPSDNPTTTGGTTPFYSRYSQAYEPTPVQTTEQIQRQKTRDAQGEINALRNEESSMLADQLAANQKDDRSTASVSALTGLAGSSEANVQQREATDRGLKANERIRAQYETQIQTILTDIRKEAATEARQQRIDARDDEGAFYANQKAKQDLATSFIKNIASSGITLDGLKEGDPKSYQYMVDQFGGEDALKGAYVLNTPKDDILDKQIKGGKYVIAKQNPVTGKISVETIDLGLPDEYTDTIDAGDRILAVPANWDGDVSKLISIPKGLTPDQAANASGAVDGYNGEFEATVNLVASTGTTKDQRAVIAQNMKEFIANGDYASAYAQIVAAAGSKLKGASSTTFTEQVNRQEVVTGLADALQAYSDAGGNTNIFKGSADKIQTRIGALYTDPKYAALATQLDSAFQAYRQQMTGAAFGAQESAEYASVLPSKNNTLDLNLEKIRGYNNYLDSSIKGYLKSAGMGEGAIYIKERAEGATDAGGGTQLSPQDIQDLRTTYPEYQNKTDEEIETIFSGDGGGGDFSGVGNTTVSITVPPSSHLAYVNRNPGNLRYAGQTGATQGQGGFAAFRSFADGFKALVGQVHIDAGRGLSLAGFINKFAPPSENDTKIYIAQLARRLGVSPTTPLARLNILDVAKEVARKESSAHIT